MSNEIRTNEGQTKESRRHNRPAWNSLHPRVYAAAVGLVLWFVVVIWLLFDSFADMELVLWVVTFFFLMVIAIPSAIWLTARRHDSELPGKPMSLRDWASGDLDTAQGRRKASSAAIELLLPIAAGAFGMTALGLVFYVVAAGNPSP
jgi:hypothetical protein